MVHGMTFILHPKHRLACQLLNISEMRQAEVTFLKCRPWHLSLFRIQMPISIERLQQRVLKFSSQNQPIFLNAMLRFVVYNKKKKSILMHRRQDLSAEQSQEVAHSVESHPSTLHLALVALLRRQKA